jgi:hypothetical protein
MRVPWSRLDKIALPTILVAFVSLSIWYGCWNPPGEGVDEAAHLACVQYVKEHRRLPVMPVGGGSSEVWIGHHPPLYYAMGALAASWIAMDDAAHGGTWPSSLLWMGRCSP